MSNTTTSKPDIRKEPKPDIRNPYALPSGETPGRLGKAWRRGYEGLPPCRGWGGSTLKAYQEGSKDEHRKIDEISEALSTLPDSVLASIETAFRILESGSTLKPETPIWREAVKMLLAAQVARCL